MKMQNSDWKIHNNPIYIWRRNICMPLIDTVSEINYGPKFSLRRVQYTYRKYAMIKTRTGKNNINTKIVSACTVSMLKWGSNFGTQFHSFKSYVLKAKVLKSVLIKDIERYQNLSMSIFHLEKLLTFHELSMAEVALLFG